MKLRSLILAAAAGFLFVASAAARAHDSWVEPKSFQPAASGLVPIHVRVGHAFEGEELARDPDRILRFFVRDSSGEREILGMDWRTPAGLLRAGEAGLHVVAYWTRPTFLELPPEKFESYLLEEGLEGVIELRAQRGESLAPGRESFARCSKALLAVGGASGEGFDRPVGLPLELVPERDPFAFDGTDGGLPLRLLLQGEALSGALVKASHRGDDLPRVQARTDAEGRVRLALDEPGDWIVAVVHMTRAEQGSGADWQSIWASLTFACPAISR